MHDQPSSSFAILYAAKSSPDEKGSIDGQLEEAGEDAAGQGLQVAGKYDEENVSAYKGDRGPELAKALEHAERIGATLIVQHSDRLARGDGKQARHLVEIALWAIKTGVRVRCIQDPSTFENLVMAVVMGERNMEDSRRKSLAVTAGLARRRKRGLYAGGHPGYGFLFRRNADDERERVIDPERAPVVQRMFAEYLAGQGETAIARALDADGIPPIGRGLWSHCSVRCILINPIYAGLIRDGKDLIEGQHEAIVDRETWERAMVLREAKARTYKRGRLPVGKHLFRKSFLRCGVCGAPMGPITNRNRTSNSTRDLYRCYGRHRRPSSCDIRAISRAKVDDAVYSYFEQLGLDVEAIRDQLAATLEFKQAEARSVLAAAELRAQEAQARIARIKGDYVAEELTAAEWRELRAELEPQGAAAEAKAERLRKELAEAESEAALSEVTSEVLAQLAEIRAEIAKEVVDADGAAAVRAVLMRLFDGFVLHRGQPGHEKREITKVDHWLEPLVSELTVAGYDEKLRPEQVHKPLAQAKNNFSSSQVWSIHQLCSEALSGQRRGRALFGALDQRQELGLAVFADQLDRVGVAVDDPLEELLAVLVGRQRPLRPAAGVVEDHR
jgi:site-specific DNA recombinase